VLNNSSPNHGSRTGEEASSDPLYRSKVYTYLPKGRIYEEITYGDKDYKCEGVEIVDNIIWNAVSDHRGSLRCQVVDYLTIRKPCLKRQHPAGLLFKLRRTIQWIPNEHSACLEPTTNLLDPFVIERHPHGPLTVRDVTWLGRLPEVFGLEIFVENNGVQRPSVPSRIAPKLDRFGKDGALRRIATIHVTSKEKDDGTKQKNNSRDNEGEIEAIIL
jgi:hypothetical protein